MYIKSGFSKPTWMLQEGEESTEEETGGLGGEERGGSGPRAL